MAGWSDDALVIGVRPHGETAVIVEVMTRERGRHLGLVHGGRGRRLRGVLQPGNEVAASWRARLDEQLGTFTVEGTRLHAARLMTSPLALLGLRTISAHLRLLPERDPHPALFEGARRLAAALDDPERAAADLVRFELLLLAELGFGLDLGACVATGRRDDLAYVSPRSGAAVSREAGQPYAPRLLPLPAFLLDQAMIAPAQAVVDGFRLTSFFLTERVWQPAGREPPQDRERFVARACAAFGAVDPV